MTGEIQHQPQDQDSDYDGAWKEALRRHLPKFLEKFFPELFDLVDWTAVPEWLDKEISQVLGQPGRRNCEVDVLVKVQLRDGQPQWLLVHLEVQSHYEEGMTFRLACYNAGLLWTFRQRVMTLVVLGDLREDWLPKEDLFRLGSFETRTRFPVCKLIRKLETDWRDDQSLPVLVARAQLAGLRTAGDPEARYRAKWQLVRGLYAAGYNGDEIREIFRLLDWMLHLRPDLGRKFERELVELEEELHMPYVTSVEQIAEERGLEKGRLEGSRQLLVRQLTRKCGELDKSLHDRLNALSVAELERLGDDLLYFTTLADLTKWLDAHRDAPSS